jgi:cytochrome b561
MLRNTSTAWGGPAKLLHAASAALVVFLLGYGAWMTHLAARSGRLSLYSLHGEVGYYLLLIVLLRLVWRALNPTPALPPAFPERIRVAAKAGHALLYAGLITASVTGWILAGTFSKPLTATLFGIWPAPMLASPGDRTLHEAMEGAHIATSYALLVLAAGHVVMAVLHMRTRDAAFLRRMGW